MTMSVYHDKGAYRVKIVSAEMSEAKNEKHTPQLELALDLIGIYGEDQQVYECKKGRYPPIVYLSITDATMGNEAKPGWVAETLAHVGFDGNFDEIGQLEGRECDAYCNYERDQKGQERERWSISRPSSGRQLRPPEKKVVRSLTAKFGKVMKKLVTDPPKPIPQQGEPIPF
jgi:hypothetical protein